MRNVLYIPFVRTPTMAAGGESSNVHSLAWLETLDTPAILPLVEALGHLAT